MKRRAFLASTTAALAASRDVAGAVAIKTSIRDRLTTRAESSNYNATTTHAEVVSFINALDARGAPIARGSIGKSHGGRDIPFVVAARPMVRTPQEAYDTGRPIVLLVGGLRGGEVEGKEALLALMRDLCISTERTLLEDLVLIFIPLLNPDGNDKLGPEAINRALQDGPPRVGIASDGNGIDLDEDFVKADAPETRALLSFVRTWAPHAFVDARSDDGCFHDYTVTYAPSLHPAAYFGGEYARYKILPKIATDLHEKFAIESFGYGHFGRTEILQSPPPVTDVAEYGWFSYDGRARTATNYMGLRGIAAVRVNGYAHQGFERRIYNVRAAIESMLGYCSDNDDDVVGSYTKSTRWLGGKVPVRGELPQTTEKRLPVTYENLALASVPLGEPGVPAGFKRTGNYTTVTMPIFDTYDATTIVDQPRGYLIPYDSVEHIKPHLDRHGIVCETLVEARRFTVQDYVVERLGHGDSSNGRQTTAIAGHWQPPSDYASRFGALYVPGAQPLGVLASVLLEPESDDGLIVWNALDSKLKIGYSVPIFRVL